MQQRRMGNRKGTAQDQKILSLPYVDVDKRRTCPFGRVSGNVLCLLLILPFGDSLWLK